MFNIAKDFENKNGIYYSKQYSSNHGFERKGNKIVSEDGKYMLSGITPGYPERHDLKLLIRDDVTYKSLEEKIKAASDWRTDAEVLELLDGVKYNFNSKDGTHTTQYGFPCTDHLIGLIPINSKVEVTSNSYWDDYLGEYVVDYQIAAIPA